MVENKVIARFSVKGAVMYSQALCNENLGKFEHKITVKVEEKVKDSLRTKYMHIPVRNCVPAERVICISVDTYRLWMQTAPTKDDQRMWSVWNKEQKVQRHLEEMARTFGDKLIGFSILPD